MRLEKCKKLWEIKSIADLVAKYSLQFRIQVDPALVVSILKPIRLNVLPHGGDNFSSRFFVNAENARQLIAQRVPFWWLLEIELDSDLESRKLLGWKSALNLNTLHRVYLGGQNTPIFGPLDRLVEISSVEGDLCLLEKVHHKSLFALDFPMKLDREFIEVALNTRLNSEDPSCRAPMVPLNAVFFQVCEFCLKERFHFYFVATHRFVQTNFIQRYVVQVVRHLQRVEVIRVLDLC